MSKYQEKPSGYFWRVRKEMMKTQGEGKSLNLWRFKGKAKTYAIMIAFADLPIIKN